MTPTINVERPFYMVRHGQTCHNITHVVSGDGVLLTHEGHKQAKALQSVYEALERKVGKCHVVASGLPRAQDTAKLMRGGVEPDAIDERLNELRCGMTAGVMSVQTFLRHRQERDLSGWGVQPDDEHMEQVVGGINDNLQSCSTNKMPVFVAHFGALVRAARSVGIPCDEHTPFKNATMYHFVPDAQTHQWRVTEVSLENGNIVETPLDLQMPSPSLLTQSAGRV